MPTGAIPSPTTLPYLLCTPTALTPCAPETLVLSSPFSASPLDHVSF